jgi:3-oxoadipate enol-lactonase
MIYQPHSELRTQAAPCDLLLIHGNMASKHWWYPTLEILQNECQRTEVRPQGTVLLGELRGHGRSPAPEDGAYSVEDHVNDFILLTEQAELKNALLVAHSAGGLIAAILLARRPDLFTGALLIDPVSPTGLHNVPSDIEARYDMMVGQRALTQQILNATIYKNNPDAIYFKTTLMDDAMVTLDRCGVRLVKSLMGIDYTSEISKIKKPVRIYYGEHDWVLPAESALIYSKIIVDSEIVFLPDNGHCLNYENPERMSSEILDFIAKEL